jgi:hypothetical protein
MSCEKKGNGRGSMRVSGDGEMSLRIRRALNQPAIATVTCESHPKTAALGQGNSLAQGFGIANAALFLH